MAESTGMFDPFEPGQILQAADGQKIISFGTSSYGYDIRCAPEFKVFTNIHSTVVDAKNFDEKSFVNFYGDSCIIPPKSFALARTLEYFRIPRNVLQGDKVLAAAAFNARVIPSGAYTDPEVATQVRHFLDVSA